MVLRKSFLSFYLSVIVSSCIYMLAINFGHVNYLPYQKSATGIFSIGHVDGFEWLVLVCAVAVAIIFLPKKINFTSDIFSLVLYYSVYVPALVLYAGRAGSLIETRSLMLVVALTIGFIIISVVPKRKFEKTSFSNIPINSRVVNILVFISIILMIYIFANNFGNMNLVGLKDIYTQRELGRLDINTSSGLLLGYSKAYLSYFFAPIILAFGLFRRRAGYITFGFFVFVFCYSIAAERSIFIYPFFIVFLYYFLNLESKSIGKSLTFLLLFSSFIIYLISLFYYKNEIIESLGFLFFTRSIAVPGQFIGDYYEYFSDHGYTLWSHLRGFNLIIPRPDYFVGDPLWPALGWIVGRDFHGINSNLNAGLWATDGIASAGSIGVIIASCFFSVYLFFLNYFGRSWPIKFLVPAIFPLAFVLTNGSLFTTLLSYGGALFAAFLWFFGIKYGKRLQSI